MRARASRARNTQLAAVLVLLVVTAYMGVGTVAYTLWVLQ